MTKGKKKNSNIGMLMAALALGASAGFELPVSRRREAKQPKMYLTEDEVMILAGLSGKAKKQYLKALKLKYEKGEA